MMAMPVANGLNTDFEADSGAHDSGIPKCMQMLIYVVMIFLAYRCGVVRGRYLERAEVKKAEAKAEAEKEEEEQATGQKAQEAQATKEVQGTQAAVSLEEIFVAPLRGERWHTHRDCHGLREAKDIRKVTPCGHCAKRGGCLEMQAANCRTGMRGHCAAGLG